MRFQTGYGNAEAYFSDPEGAPVAQVIVVHEVWGFTPFIQDACVRLSKQGFRSVAPLLYWRNKDLFAEKNIREGLRAVWGLSLAERRQPAKLEEAIKKGGASGEAAEMLRILYDKRFRSRILRDLISLAGVLRREHPDLLLGTLGFSMGGKLAMQLASGDPHIAACAGVSSEPVVGQPLTKVSCPILLVYGAKDSFMLRQVHGFVDDAIDKGKDLELRIFPSAGHEFFDHTDKKDFLPAAAAETWEIAGGFLKKNLTQRAASNQGLQ
jgi:dienelactone hydrolase